MICNDRLAVVDWENSHESGLPLYDLVFFAARSARLLGGRNTLAAHLLAEPLDGLGISQAAARLARAYEARTGCCMSTEELEALARLAIAAESLGHDREARSPETET
jgi:hypothetical protein